MTGVPVPLFPSAIFFGGAYMMDEEAHRSGTRERTGFWRSFNALLDNFMEELDGLLEQWLPVTAPKTRGKTVGYPLTDLVADEDCYIVEAELPGAHSEDIEVEVTADKVTIKGQVNVASNGEEKDHRYILKERRRHDFNREIVFPESVNPKEADARLDEGILRIKVPREEPETLKVVKIKVE